MNLAPSLCAVLFSLLLPCAAAMADDEADEPDVPAEVVVAPEGPVGGSYVGEVRNGEGMDPVLTAFSRDAEGRWSGTYALGEADGIEVGSLDACEWETSRLLHCTWRDRHGEGVARLLFSGDYRAFRGFWGTKDDDASMPWDGTRHPGRR